MEREPADSRSYLDVLDDWARDAQQQALRAADACRYAPADDAYRRAFLQTMDRVFLAGGRELQRQFPIHNVPLRIYLQDRLAPLLGESSFWRRAYEKPLGSSPDYLLVDMTSSGRLADDMDRVALGALLDEWFLGLPLVKAVRARHEHMVRLLGRAIEAGTRRIAVLTCGSGRELWEALARLPKRPKGLTIVLAGLEPRAMQFTREQASKWSGHGVTFHFLQASGPQGILGGPDSPLKDCDLAYTLDYADTCEDSQLLQMAGTARKALGRDGTLVLGVLAAPNAGADPFGSEWFLDWDVESRSPKALAALLKDTWVGERLRFEWSDDGNALLALAGHMAIETPKPAAASDPMGEARDASAAG